MIDNYDSFTYNVVQYCRELGADLKIIRNDELTIEEIKALNPEKIILSPGPSTPDDAGVTLDVIETFADTTPIFKDLPSEFRATRYHSLTVNKENLPENIIATSHSKDDDEIMSLQIKDKPIYGVQFHPESIMSEHGHEMLDNFLKL